ncbi:leucine-rich repeat flightless-interacting protein 2-like [Hippocampus comes]|nr:PREDICTED: leucine-rich repeat flightless-interacting protein 2-like [Hippocampus comes]
MGTQGPGRKRLPNLEKLTAEDDALNQIAREAEARLAARRTARAEARDIRMKELEKQHKEKYYGLDYKWGHIEQWMEDGERYSRHARRLASLSDDEERMSVGSRGSLKPSDYSSFLGSGSRASSRASSARASPVVEERPDRDFLDRGSRTALNLSAATLSSLGGASSRRGSCDTSVSVEMEASIREMKVLTGCGNPAVDRDDDAQSICMSLLGISNVTRVRLQAYERERDSHVVLQFQFKEMKETMRRSEDLMMEVSKLREQTHAYSQVVSDLQEALQWKEMKIAALERQREISDVIQIERDQLRVEVLSLRDVVKKYGDVISPEVATDGGPRLDDAEDEVSDSFASRLANEAPGSGESMLGKTRLPGSTEYHSTIVKQGCFQFKEMKETMRRSEDLMTALERQREISDVIQIERDQLRVEVLSLRDVVKKYGDVISPEVATDGGPRLDDAEDEVGDSFASRLANEAPGSGESMLELHLRKLFEERESFQDQVRMLKAQLLLRQRNWSDGSQNPDQDGLENGTDSHMADLQRDASRQISDLKFKLVKSEQEVATLEQNVIRLEGQVTRYRTASESAEMLEDELKVERRKLHRELRSALDRIQELEATNGLLAKRLEKMKANRNILLAQQ